MPILTYNISKILSIQHAINIKLLMKSFTFFFHTWPVKAACFVLSQPLSTRASVFQYSAAPRGLVVTESDSTGLERSLPLFCKTLKHPKH